MLSVDVPMCGDGITVRVIAAATTVVHPPRHTRMEMCSPLAAPAAAICRSSLLCPPDALLAGLFQVVGCQFGEPSQFLTCSNCVTFRDLI